MDQTPERGTKATLTKTLGSVVAEARRAGMPARDAFRIVAMLAAELAAQDVPEADISAMTQLLNRIGGHRG